MAKSPGKAPATTAPKPAALAKPKAAKKTSANGAGVEPAAAKIAAKPAAAKIAGKPAASKIATKPVKVAEPKAKAEPKSVFSETSSKISRLASDILEDRIIPTIEQIKTMAASVLGQDRAKGKKSKGKKKKK